MAKKITICVAIAGLLFALAPSADAAILTSENYNDGTGANADGLTYTQGAVTIGEVGTNKGRNGVERYISLTGTTNSGQYFVRALVRRTAVNNHWGGVSFFRNTNEMLYFGIRPPSANPRRNWGMANYGSGKDADDGLFNASEVYFMVGMIDYDNDEAKLWINPTFGLTAPAADATATGWDLSNASTRVRLRGQYDTTLYFDEIVVGTTWGDVVPVPEPASMALLLLGLPFVMRRKSRHGG